MNDLKERGLIEWLRYFDDIFVLIRTVTDLYSILKFQNKIHPSQFTFELKQYDSISGCSGKIRTREIYNNDLQKENLYWDFIEFE